MAEFKFANDNTIFLKPRVNLKHSLSIVVKYSHVVNGYCREFVGGMGLNPGTLQARRKR